MPHSLPKSEPAKEDEKQPPFHRPIGEEFRFKQIQVFDYDVKSKTTKSEDKTMRVPDPAKEVKRRPIGDEFRFKQIRVFDNDTESKTTEDKTTRVLEPRKEEEKQQPLRRPIGDEFRFKQIRVFDNDTQSKTTTTEDKKENDQTGKEPY